MRCGIYLTAQDAKAMWAEVIRTLSRPGMRWQMDDLILDGPLDDGLYEPAALTDALMACSYLEEARALLLPQGTALPGELPDWEALRHSPAMAAVYYVDWIEFEIYTMDADALSRLATLAASPQVETFEWIDDGDVGRTCF